MAPIKPSMAALAALVLACLLLAVAGQERQLTQTREIHLKKRLTCP